VHLFTVDRHLIETAVHASGMASRVARPDLLLIGAFLHDIGKGYAGDHSVVGAVVARSIAQRMGFSERDAATISDIARHHLLLPDTATRRDLDDPSTLHIVNSAIGSSADLLELLHVVTIADAAATGPAAWSEWKGSLVAKLVARARCAIGGDPLPPPELPSEQHARAGQTRVVIEASDVIVVAPDGPGVLSGASGLLALHSLDVQSADVRTVGRMAVNRFTVTPRFGQFPDVALLNADLRHILERTLPLEDRLRAKEATYGRTVNDPTETRLLWFDDEATDATVLEVRTRDTIGLLHRVTAALEAAAVDIRSARISSLGAHVVDAFYVTDADGKPLTETQQAAVSWQMSNALAS
jgi:[protein-PII] uridylyltransferase